MTLGTILLIVLILALLAHSGLALQSWLGLWPSGIGRRRRPDHHRSAADGRIERTGNVSLITGGCYLDFMIRLRARPGAATRRPFMSIASSVTK